MGWIDELLTEGLDLTAGLFYECLGFSNVAGTGLDGLYAIAGPLCAATVVLPPDHTLQLNYDMLKLRLHDLIPLGDQIRAASTLLNIGWCNAHIIYRAGKQEAQKMAISTSYSRITAYNPVSIVLVEGYEFPVPPLSLEKAHIPLYTCKTPCKTIESIIAAKIVAKVARETKMKMLHRIYPEFGWNENHGNMSNQHIEAIKTHGITDEHRDLSNIKALQGVQVFPHKRLGRII